MVRLGTGIGWRPEIAREIARLPGLDWVEVVAENTCPDHLPKELSRLHHRGVPIVPHGVGLGLGGAEPPSPARLVALAHLAETLDSPLVTEHIAFVRAGGPLTGDPRREAGHLLPLPRTRDALDVLCANVRIAQDALPVPLALENIAALFTWPGEEMTEAEFLSELVDRTGVRLLIDVANLHTNHVNRGEDPWAALAGLPLESLAYVHVAGGVERDGVWHDSHAHPVPQQVLDILADLCARTEPPGVLLERDDDFPAPGELARELDQIRAVVAGSERSALPPPSPGSMRRPPVRPAAGAGATSADARSTAGARARLAKAQSALLASLVAGAPAPEGFDQERLRVQRDALVGKRVRVMAKVAPELPEILGARFPSSAREFARRHPMTGGYRAHTVEFVRETLRSDTALERSDRRVLRRWLRSAT